MPPTRRFIPFVPWTTARTGQSTEKRDASPVKLLSIDGGEPAVTPAPPGSSYIHSDQRTNDSHARCDALTYCHGRKQRNRPHPPYTSRVDTAVSPKTVVSSPSVSP